MSVCLDNENNLTVPRVTDERPVMAGDRQPQCIFIDDVRKFDAHAQSRRLLPGIRATASFSQHDCMHDPLSCVQRYLGTSRRHGLAGRLSILLHLSVLRRYPVQMVPLHHYFPISTETQHVVAIEYVNSPAKHFDVSTCSCAGNSPDDHT